MKEQLLALQSLKKQLRTIFAAEDITVSEYPVLAKLSFATACMLTPASQENPIEFNTWLDIALRSANEIVKPQRQDFYAFTEDKWYQRNGCHQLIISMQLLLTDISKSLGTDASMALESHSIPDTQQQRSSSPPKLGAY